MLFITILAVFIAAFIKFLIKLNENYALHSLCRRIKTLDGTPIEKTVAIGHGRTIFGNTFDMIAMNSGELFYYSRGYASELKRSYLQYVIFNPIYNIITANDAELVMSDANFITKGIVYNFLHPFLKTGLLTSTDKKWHTRRKLLTPAFHFNILTHFVEIFKQESEKFIKKLDEIIDADPNNNIINLDELIPRLTLNNICETALGVKLDECQEGDIYRENLKKIEESFVKRITNPLLTNDNVYNIFGDGFADRKYSKQIHAFSKGIINKRRILLAEQIKENPSKNNENDFEFLNKKQRYAMLDTLLYAERDGLIDEAGICEEVDTFVFEGFDTTSMNLIFALMNLSLYPDQQKLCYEEINSFIDDDLSKLDIAQLNNLRYLDKFLKETQRLYPSVPVILRQCMKDMKLANNLFLPKGTQITIHIFDIHRNPDYYEQPNEFRPERFDVENARKRHPYAFIPFSAGQRNCIGQKFAMLEMKTLLVYILKNYELLPVTDPKSFRFLAGILIRSMTEVQIKLKKRNKN